MDTTLALALAAFAALVYVALLDARPVAGRNLSTASVAVARTRERFVCGEIDRSEYERIVRILTD